MDKRDEIKNNPFLTPEEKESSLNLIAMTEVQKKAILESDKSDAEKSSDLNYYDLIIEEIINKSKRIADKRKKEEKKNREKEKAEVKNKLEVLSYLKNENGEKIYSKAYLKSMSNEKIKKIYNEFERKNPSLLKKIREEIVRPRVYKGNINKKLGENHEESNQNIKKINNREVTVSDIAKSLGTTPEELIKEFNKRREYDKKVESQKKIEAEKPQKKMVKIKRLDADKFKSEEKDDLDGQKIAKEEDGSRFTKFKRFVSKHKKAILIGATLGVLGGIALYYAMKQGDASTVHDTITSMKGAGEVAKDTVVNNVPDDHTNVNHIVENVKDLAENVKDAAKANEGKVYNTAQNLAQQTNGVTPSDWFIYDNWDAYITSDGIVHEGNFTVDQLIEMKTNGVDIVGVRTGNPNLDYPYSGYATLNDIIAHSKDAIGGKVK